MKHAVRFGMRGVALAVAMVTAGSVAHAQNAPTFKVSFGRCTIENGITDETIAAIKKPEGGRLTKAVQLNNVTDAHLKKLVEVADQIEDIEFWNESPDLKDLSPLAEFKGLKTLRLASLPRLKDISPVAKLVALEELTLYVVYELNDLAPIGELKGLKKLALTNVGQAEIDLAPVGKLSQLKEVAISQGVKYTTFEWVRNLNALEKAAFLAEPKDVIDLAPFAGKAQLKTLSFNQAQITDISPLKDCAALTTLRFSGQPIADYSPLANLKAMQHLELSFRKAPDADISPIAAMSKLEVLDLTASTFKSYAAIAELKELKSFSANRDSGFGDLSVLAGLPKLSNLSLSENQAVTKWEPLASMKALTQLNLFKTSFKDLRLLGGLPKLGTLSMQKCTLEHPEALLGLPALRMIYINGATGISDLTVFAKAHNVANLHIGYDAKQFPQEQIDAFKAVQKAAVEAAKKPK